MDWMKWNWNWLGQDMRWMMDDSFGDRVGRRINQINHFRIHTRLGLNHLYYAARDVSFASLFFLITLN